MWAKLGAAIGAIFSKALLEFLYEKALYWIARFQIWNAKRRTISEREKVDETNQKKYDEAVRNGSDSAMRAKRLEDLVNGASDDHPPGV